MRRLHRRDRAAGAQQRHVARAQQLQVLDARPQRPDGGQRGVRGQHFGASRISDGVDARLETRRRDRLDAGPQLTRLR